MTRPRLPIGTSDFLQLRRGGLHYVDKSGFVTDVLLRRGGLHYVDKSDFVTDVLWSNAQVILVPRPRRFGKTLSLSTLRAFVERTGEDRTDVFSALASWRAGADVRGHFGRYPVIFLTFKNVKTKTWANCRAAILMLVAAECQRHAAEIEPVLGGPGEWRIWRALRSAQTDDATLWRALALLSEWLDRATGERAMISVDEYDTPIHAGYHHDFYDNMIALFRNLFSGGFQDDRHLEKGVSTGIPRVAKEPIFRELNNLAVYTSLSKPFAEWFGFTPQEVDALAGPATLKPNSAASSAGITATALATPRSTTPGRCYNFLAPPEDGYRSYWVQTASDDILRGLLIERGMIEEADLETRVTGGSVTQAIDAHIGLRDVLANTDAIWSFLLFSGYLKALSSRIVSRKAEVELAVPNLEVRGALGE